MEGLAGGARLGHFLVRYLFTLPSTGVLMLTVRFSSFFRSISVLQADRAQYLAIGTDPANAQSNKVSSSWYHFHLRVLDGDLTGTTFC